MKEAAPQKYLKTISTDKPTHCCRWQYAGIHDFNPFIRKLGSPNIS